MMPNGSSESENRCGTEMHHVPAPGVGEAVAELAAEAQKLREERKELQGEKDKLEKKNRRLDAKYKKLKKEHDDLMAEKIKPPADGAALEKHVRYFIQLTFVSERLDALHKEVVNRVKPLKEILLKRFEESGVKNVAMDGRNVHTRRQIWAGAANHKLLGEALKEMDLAEFVKENVHGGQFSAYVREFDPDRDKSPQQIIDSLPETIRDLVKVREDWDVRITRA